MNYRSGAINIGNGFLHITLKKRVLKFDIVNAAVPFYKRGHNFETGAKLNKAGHTFSNKVSLSILDKFQLIPSEGMHK